MIRGLLVLAGLLLGLALAAATEGRLGHLRAYAPGLLPGWTAPLTDDSGLARGRARAVPLGPLLAELDYALDGLGPEGARYLLRAEAPVSRFTARLTWLFSGALRIDGGSGETDLAAAFTLPLAGLTGRLVVETLGGEIDRATMRYLRLEIGGRVEALRLEGTLLGDGRFTLANDGAEGWRGELAVAGEVLDLTAEASGQFGSPAVLASAKIAEGVAFPGAWRQALVAYAAFGEGGWLWQGVGDLTALQRAR